MTEHSRPRRPRAVAVVWASTLLFAALFALLTYDLSLAGPPSQVAPTPLVRMVIKRRVVTTIVPTPGENTVSSSSNQASYSSPGSVPVTTSAS
jgi:hypothetical protein